MNLEYWGTYINEPDSCDCDPSLGEKCPVCAPHDFDDCPDVTE